MMNPSAPPMMVQAMIEPVPDWSPWVESSAMREPSGVVYHEKKSGLELSVPLSIDTGWVIPFTAHRREVLSSSRQDTISTLSRVPPVLKATMQTGARAFSQAWSWARIVAWPAAVAAAYLACCTASIWASVFSVLVSKHCSMPSVVDWLPQLAGAGLIIAGWPGSNGSTMLMNPAALAGLVAEAEWVEVAGPLVLLLDDDELLQPAARPITAVNN